MTVLAPAIWPSLEDVVDPIRTDHRRLPTRSRAWRTRTPTPTALVSALGFAIALRIDRAEGSCRRPRAAAAPDRVPPRLRDRRGRRRAARRHGLHLRLRHARAFRRAPRRGRARPHGREHRPPPQQHRLRHDQPRRRDGQRDRPGDLPPPASCSAPRSAHQLRPISTRHCFTDTGGFRHENTTEAALRLARHPRRRRCRSRAGWPSRATSRAPSRRSASRAWPSRRCTRRWTGACSGPR